MFTYTSLTGAVTIGPATATITNFMTAFINPLGNGQLPTAPFTQAMPLIGVTCMGPTGRQYKMFQVNGYEAMTTYARDTYPNTTDINNQVDQSAYISPTSKNVTYDTTNQVLMINLYQAITAYPGDAVAATVQVTTFGSVNASYNLTTQYFVPVLGSGAGNLYCSSGTVACNGTTYDNISTNLVSAQFNATINAAYQAAVLAAYQAGTYIFKVFLQVNNGTAVEYNPDMSHVTRQADRFSVVFDSTGIISATALTLVIRKDGWFTNYTATTTLTPNTTATQYDYLITAFNDTTGNVSSILFGKFTAFLLYTAGGTTKLVFCHVTGNANTVIASFDALATGNNGVPDKVNITL